MEPRYEARQLDQAAGGHRAGDVVDALGRWRLAEVAVGQPVGADVLDEVAGDAPGGLAIGVAAGVDGGQREAV